MADQEAASLAYEFTYTAQVHPPVDCGATPLGARMGFVMGEGEVTGERIKGRLVSGADWILIGADGYGRVDVRANIATHDGAAIYIHYTGFLQMNEKVGAALQTGVGTEFSDAYLRTSPRLECGDPRYAWVNHTVFVSAGRLLAGGIVEYRVYRVD